MKALKQNVSLQTKLSSQLSLNPRPVRPWHAQVMSSGENMRFLLTLLPAPSFHPFLYRSGFYSLVYQKLLKRLVLAIFASPKVI